VPRNAGDGRGRRRAVARGVTRLGRAALFVCSLLASSAQAQDAVVGVCAQRDRFTVMCAHEDLSMARAMADAAVARDTFPALPRSRTAVVLLIAPNTATFAAWAGPLASEATQAVALVERHRVVLRGRGAPPLADDPLQVLRHELAHVALFDYFGKTAPRWFEEGYASYAAGEERTTGFLATNAAMLFRQLPSLNGLDSLLLSRRPTEARAGYALALRAVVDLAALGGTNELAPLLVAWKERGSFDLALRRSAALTADQFEARWQQRTRWQFAFLALATDSALVGALLLALLLPVYRARRRRYERRLAQLRQDDAETESARREAIVDDVARGIDPDRTRARDARSP
jgi:hypothetical protein